MAVVAEEGIGDVHNAYPNIKKIANPKCSSELQFSGSWVTALLILSFRVNDLPNFGYLSVGFRCALIEPSMQVKSWLEGLQEGLRLPG